MKILLIIWTLIGISLAVPINPVNATTVTVTAELAPSSEQGPLPGIFKFTRTGDLTQPLNVNFTLGGNAVKETDYLIWENSAQFEAMSDTAFVTILPVNDTLKEGDETVVVTLSPGTGYAIGTPNSATITIIDAPYSAVGAIVDTNENSWGLTRDISYLQTTIDNGQLFIAVGLNTAIQMTHVSVWLDTDQNPMTGDFRHGYIGGAEYRVDLFVTTPSFADYTLFKLPTNINDCDSVQQGGQCEKALGNPANASVQNNVVFFSIPLNLIGNPTAVDVFATTYEASNANSIPGNGDRVPNYGALDTKTGRVVVRRPGKTVMRTITDRTGDTTGLGFDLKTASFASIADQLLMSLQFSQPFDTTHPLLGQGPRGQVTFDSDHLLMTGDNFMGNQIPTWGGDGLFMFDFTTLVPLLQYSIDVTGSGRVLFATEHNDGRWFAQGDSLTIAGSLSIFDAFFKTNTNSTRIQSDGRMLITAESLEIGPSLIDAKPIDHMPDNHNAFDTTTGMVVQPLAWDATRTLTQSDPLEYGQMISGLDLTRIDAEVVDDNLVIKGVLSTWLNTDYDNLFQILLDMDMNNTTGFSWGSNNGGQTIGVDLVLQIFSIDGVVPFYVAQFGLPNGDKTIHDAMVLPQPSFSAGQPGSFTVTIPINELRGISNFFNFGPQVRFYVITGTNLGAIGQDTAPPQPMIVNIQGIQDPTPTPSPSPSPTPITCTDPYEPNNSFSTAYGPLIIGNNYAGKICSSTDTDYFRIDVASIGTITVNLSVPSDMDYDLYLYNPSKTEIGSSVKDTGVAEKITKNVSTTGTYYIKVMGYGGDYDTSKTYTLSGTWPSATASPNVTSFKINNDASSTTSQTVTLNNTATGSPTHYMASESSAFTSATWKTYFEAPNFTLSVGSGAKTVYFKVKNSSNVESNVMSDSITLNEAPLITSFSINNGASSTTSQTVTLNNTATGSPTHYMASESSAFTSATWKTYFAAPNFTLSVGSGAKTVYFKVKNSSNVESNVMSDSITLSQSVQQAFYTFDEGSGTVAGDSSGGNNHGAVVGATWTTGRNGGGLSFDGTNDCVELGNPSSLQPATVSLSAWFKTSAAGGMILRKRMYGYGLEVVSSGKIAFWICNAAATKFMATSSNAYNDNAWHHAVGVYNGSTVKLYIDGSPVATAGAGAIYYGTGGIAVGRDGNFSGSYFKGLVDEVRIYGKILSDQEVLDLYTMYPPIPTPTPTPSSNLQAYYPFNEGGGTVTGDSSGNGNNGTVNWATWVTGKNGGGLTFNGVNSYVDVGNPLNLQPGKISLSAWFKTAAASGMIMRKRGYGYGLEVASAGKISFWIYNASIAKFMATSLNAYNDNQWHHAVGVYDGSTVKLFIDGSQAASASAGAIYYGAGGIAIGRDGNFSGSYFNGLIDEIRVYNNALSTQDVLDLYNQFTPGPVSHWKFDEGSGTVAGDSSGNGNNGTVNGATWATGKNGGGLTFNGVNSYVDVGNPSSLQPGKISLSAWFKTTAASGMIMRKRGYGYGLEMASAGKISFWIYNASITKFMATSLNAYNDNQWHHAVGVYDGSTVKLFIDGSQAASASAGAIYYGAGGIAIGRDGNFSGSYFSGIIDEVSIYNLALSDQEIQGIYHAIAGTSAVASLDALSGIKDMDNANITSETGITLRSFHAEVGHDGSVTLRWETTAETDTAGFNLYRSRRKNGRYTKVNNVLINAGDIDQSGARYHFEDEPDSGKSYYYKLECVDYYDKGAMHSPIKVRMKSPDYE